MASKLLYDPERDGVTQGILSAFVDCRERARLVLMGWTGAVPGFHLVFGSISHYVLRQAYTQFRAGELEGPPDHYWLQETLDDAHRIWKKENPHPNEKAIQVVEEVLMKLNAILPSYFQYWKRDFDRRMTEWLEVEETFRIPFTVTTRRGKTLSTFLRGRVDGTFRLPGAASVKRRAAPRLFETKNRSQVDEEMLVDTMPYERQTNLYLIALRHKLKKEPASVLLNIIRKPQLRQKQAESFGQYEKRIQADVKSRLDFYFIRMEMSVQPQDINRNEAELHDMVSDFLLWRAGESGHYKNSNACRFCDFRKVCAREDYAGLVRRTIIFSELEDE